MARLWDVLLIAYLHNVTGNLPGNIVDSNVTVASRKDLRTQTAQPADSTSACSNTVWVAFSCLSGG